MDFNNTLGYLYMAMLPPPRGRHTAILPIYPDQANEGNATVKLGDK